MATIKAFKKEKFGIIVKPHVGVLTFDKWIEQGLRPKEGEHAVIVRFGRSGLSVPARMRVFLTLGR
jgi:hypothetical protein